jgi:hypothetical protein
MMRQRGLNDYEVTFASGGGQWLNGEVTPFTVAAGDCAMAGGHCTLTSEGLWNRKKRVRKGQARPIAVGRARGELTLSPRNPS